MTRPKPDETGLKFYPASHRYKLDGKWVPGVTTLIKNGMPKEALMYWSARTVAEFVADNKDLVGRMYSMGRGPMVAALKETPWQKRDNAAVRGSEVHALAEKIIHGEEVAVPEEIGGYVDQCVRFMDEWQPQPLVVERPCASRADWWAGTPDLIASVADGRTLLWDYKTADSGIWPETAFQLAAYRHAEFYLHEDGTERPLPKIDDCVAVWLQPDDYEVIPLKTDADVYAEFLSIKGTADAAKRAKGNKTTPGYVGLPLVAPGKEEDAA